MNTTLCLVGKNDETACFGDGGSPAIWEDQKDYNRAYLIGIFTEPLRIPQCEALPVLPSKYAFVPHVLEWIRKEGGNEVDEASCIPTGKLKLGSPTLEVYTSHTLPLQKINVLYFPIASSFKKLPIVENRDMLLT